MGVDGEVSAIFAVADAPQEETYRTLQKLHDMGLEVRVVTGDNARTAFTIAEQLGMTRTNVMADMLPSQKVSKVKELQTSGRIVAMVGDGTNDSPALAQADLVIAIVCSTEIGRDGWDGAHAVEFGPCSHCTELVSHHFQADSSQLLVGVWLQLPFDFTDCSVTRK